MKDLVFFWRSRPEKHFLGPQIIPIVLIPCGTEKSETPAKGIFGRGVISAWFRTQDWSEAGNREEIQFNRRDFGGDDDSPNTWPAKNRVGIADTV